MKHMFLYLTFVLASMVVGCVAESEVTLDDKIQGTWDAPAPGPYSCLLVLKFEAPNFGLAKACELSGGQIGVDLVQGDYALSEGQATLDPYEGSCPESWTGAPFAADLRLTDDDHLRLGLPGGAIVFERSPTQRSESAVIVYGCDRPDTFDPMPIQPL